MKRTSRNIIGCALAGALFLTTALANATGPAYLTSKQMDAVTAGAQTSSSAATASARYGFAATSSQTYAQRSGPVTITSSTSSGLAGGTGAGAGATAGTVLK